jgi:hypothetical protein
LSVGHLYLDGIDSTATSMLGRPAVVDRTYLNGTAVALAFFVLSRDELMRRFAALPADQFLQTRRYAADGVAHSSCAVGRNRISLMSTSSGWLMANSTQRAKLSVGMAFCW